jgi:hypothetical protein
MDTELIEGTLVTRVERDDDQGKVTLELNSEELGCN